jgi:hypothetical protein
MSTTTYCQLQAQSAKLAKVMVCKAVQVANMYERMSKDKRNDLLLIEDFLSSLRSDPSIKGQIAAVEIIMEVSYFDDATKIIG